MLYIYINAGHTQKNVVVSKLNKEFNSHPTRSQHTLLTVGTVKVSRAYCGAAEPGTKMASSK
jgi:hypothetical protein